MLQAPWSARGTGGFAQELRRRIDQVLPRGAEARSKVDRVVCVADADRPSNLVPGFRAAPAPGNEALLEAWVRELESAWKAHLVKTAHLDASQSARVEVLCLRWSKESVLIAAHDALVAACEAPLRPQVDELLAKCIPADPRSTPDEGFTDRFRDPQRCVEQVLRAGKSEPYGRYKKGRDDEDILREKVTPAHYEALLKRCPDLVRLLDLLQ